MSRVIAARSPKAAAAGKVFYISARTFSATAGTGLVCRIEPMRNNKD